MKTIPQDSLSAQVQNILMASSYKERPELSIPKDYHEQVDTLYRYYYGDELFGWLVDLMSILIAGHSSSWVIEISGNKKKKAELEKAEEEEEIWWYFDKYLNNELDNMTIGGRNVDITLARHLILTSMAGVQFSFNDFKIPEKRVDAKPYRFPTKIVDIYSNSILLKRIGTSSEIMQNEDIYIKQSESANDNIKEGGIPQTSSLDNENPDTSQYTKLISMNQKMDKGAYVIKAFWSHSAVKIKEEGKKFEVIEGLYPTPVLTRVIPHLKMRQTLNASDLQAIDGVMKAILVWEMDKSIEIKPERTLKSGVTEKGTLQLVQEWLQKLKLSGVMEMTLPPGIKPSWVTPPTDVLLDADKYLAPTLGILTGFGIIPFPQQMGDMRSFNIKSFKELIAYYRYLLKSFWDKLALIIWEKNEKLFLIPERVYSPIRFFEDNILEMVDKERARGTVSVETFHDMIGINSKTETQRLERERPNMELYQESVPTQFRQDTVDKETTKSTDSKNKAGRPKKETASEGKTIEKSLEKGE